MHGEDGTSSVRDPEAQEEFLGSPNNASPAKTASGGNLDSSTSENTNNAMTKNASEQIAAKNALGQQSKVAQSNNGQNASQGGINNAQDECSDAITRLSYF